MTQCTVLSDQFEESLHGTLVVLGRRLRQTAQLLDDTTFDDLRPIFAAVEHIRKSANARAIKHQPEDLLLLSGDLL